jgi:hypothetical protein
MISVVCVYNSQEILKKHLLKSLANQTAKYELIRVDNSGGNFKAACKALNHGGRKAKGEYLMFVHQDVVLYSRFWLEDVEKILDNVSLLGVAGCSGMGEDGKMPGFIKDRGCLWGRPVTEPKEVQSLDECLLIVPKAVFDRFKFDETLPGWHAYGVDYCLTVREHGLKAYVIPAFIHHDSLNVWPALDPGGLLRAHRKVWVKHRSSSPCVFTSCGKLWWGRCILPLFLQRILRPFYRNICPTITHQPEYLEKKLGGCEKILFLHWGKDFLTEFRSLPHLIKTETFTSEEGAKRRDILHQYVSAEDIRKMRFDEGSFDAVILTSEILENLSDNSVVMEKVKGWASKRVVVAPMYEFDSTSGE